MAIVNVARHSSLVSALFALGLPLMLVWALV